VEIGTKNHHKSEQPKTIMEIGRLHHLQTVGIGTARWFVLRGVVVRASRRGLGGYRSEKRATPWVSPWWWLASVGPDLRKEPWVDPWWWLVVSSGWLRKEKKKLVSDGFRWVDPWWWLASWWFQVVSKPKPPPPRWPRKPNQPPHRRFQPSTEAQPVSSFSSKRREHRPWRSCFSRK
jgi:hypothetical protein